MHTLFVQRQTCIILLCYRGMLQSKRSPPPPPLPKQALHTIKMGQSGQPCSLLFTDLSETMCDLVHDVILQGRCLLQRLPIWCCLLPFQPFTPVPFS